MSEPYLALRRHALRSEEGTGEGRGRGGGGADGESRGEVKGEWVETTLDGPRGRRPEATRESRVEREERVTPPRILQGKRAVGAAPPRWWGRTARSLNDFVQRSHGRYQEL